MNSSLRNPFQRASRLHHSPSRAQNGERSRSLQPELQRSKAPEKEADGFTKLGDKIAELVGAGSRSIHQAMRDVVASISSLYQHAAQGMILSQKNKVRTNDRFAQTSQ